jgi:exopolysaccharide biosynthesis predicted pyruvyltransferase EpsI
MVGRMIQELRHALSVRSSINASKQKILSEIGGSPDITFIRARGNIGDHLIHAGTRRLLAGLPYKEVVVGAHRGDSHKKTGVPGLEGVRGHTALITGSGSWCGPYHGLIPRTLRVAERHFEMVIVLPSSVDTSVERVRKILSETRALFFTREQVSYRMLQGVCEVDIAHDCAFFFDFGPYKHRGEGLLTTFRTDAESAYEGAVPPNNDDISISCESLDEWLWTIARHGTVETDRAHVMIAAAMLGKKVKYRPGSYHKVPAIAEYALKGFPVERMPEELP